MTVLDATGVLENASSQMTPGVSPPRPRPLSYLARWGRTRQWLPRSVRRTIDVGCAFGYGTAALIGYGSSARSVVGVEYDGGLVRLAAQRFPWVPVIQADAGRLPFQDGDVDAIVMLDVLEHLADPAAVLAEIHRVLRPGGYLVLSVPHQGVLAPLDANNVYTALRRRWPSWPELEATDRSATDLHRHFSLKEVHELLGGRFRVDRVARTGLGIAEVIHLFILLVFRAWLPWRGAYLVLRQLHFVTYLLEDFVQTGKFGYHLTLRARAVSEGDVDTDCDRRDRLAVMS